ncbi:MAG: hypothetical protein DIU61_009610 [Bacteroidota bacterium]
MSAFEKLVARAVALNKELGSAKSFKEISQGMKQASEAEQELIKKSEELQASLARLQKMYDEQAKKLAELSTKASETRKNYGSIGDSFADVGNKLDSSDNPFKKAIANLVSLNNQLKQNREAQKTLQGQKSVFQGMDQSLPDVQRGLAEINKREQELVAEEKLLRAEITATNKEIRQRISLNQADANTREFIKQQIAELKRERDFSVNINTEEGIARLGEINAEIDRLNKILEQTADNLEQRKINIGNYPGAAKIIVDALEQARRKTEELTASLGPLDPAAQAARRELEALERITENPGFMKLAASAGDTQREVKTLTRSLIELERAGMGNSEVARELRHEIGALKRQLGDVKAEIKAAASEIRNFDLFAQSVNFLAHSFETAAGAVALFTDSEEDAQVVTKNLVAIQSVANGIRGVAHELTSRGTAANKAYAFVQKQVAIATDASATATMRLNAALKLLGIGLIITAVTWLITKFIELSNAQKKAAEHQNKLNEATKEYHAQVVKLNQELGRSLDDQTQGLRDQLALLEKQGATAYELFELKKRIAQSDKDNALQQLRDLDLTAAKVDQMIIKQDQLNEQLAKAYDFRKKALEIDFDDAVESADILIESLQKEIEVNAELIRQGQALVKTYQDSAEALKQLTAEEARFTREEKLKATLEANRRLLQDSIDINTRIAADERNRLEVRLIALERIGKAQRELIIKQRDFELADVTKTELQKQTIRENAAAEILKLERDTQQRISEERRKYQEREFAAQYEILRSNIETYAAINLRIAEDENKSLELRLENILQYYNRQRALITAQRDFELRNQTLTESEKKAIQERANNELLLLQAEFVKKSNEIQSQGLEQSLQFSINRNNRRRDILLGNLAAERQAGLISEEEYQKKRSDIEFRYAQSDLEILINGLRNQVDARRKAGEDVSELEAQLAEYQKQLRENDLEHTKQTEEQKFKARVEKLNKLKEITGNVFGVIAELAQIQFDTEKARIEESIADIERKRDAELAAINASALSEQEKADKIQILEAKVQAQKEQQERRLKQIEADRARFERAITIQRIIADTAAAVVAALGSKPYSPLNIALAATVGALGAAQLARVIATPLPRFAEGTDDAPGGLSVVGDAYRSELVREPSGKMWVTPNVPTVMNVPKHSIVYPDARQALESGLVVNRHGRLVQAGTDTSKIEQKLDKLTTVIKNKPVLNMSATQGGLTAMWQYGANWVTYVDDCTGF